ncbi:hypothetical protein [Urbifossiella limnaea]|uniref:Cytochrome c domain-containing protein n=1 Tax=Urbifossiella limnaea TaxID=2528023 RepID=A0A517Y0A5_9BACT|nr:hypothetical protein [Urbifossiella limnaea]QDU23191.1 hypothetical protein ETAA1_51830 [Urbifossiella limnaea]
MRPLFALAVLAAVSQTARADDPVKVFEQRLLPIFKSPNPSSCVQCHLAAVDLKDYILPSSRDTFLALRDQGLIDLERPDDSRILKLIGRGKTDPGAKLIPAGVRDAEYAAFSAWIKACADDPQLKAAKAKAPALAVKPVEVVRHARADRVTESFASNVWAMRFRCMNCHTEGTPACDKHVKEHGERVAWFKRGGPEATMNYLLGSGLLDFSNPENSLLLRKPLGGVKHGGGIKFVTGDQGYRAFRGWIEDAAAVRAGKYAKAADLPPPERERRFGSEAWLKLTNTPPEWGDKLLQADVYAWDAAANKWEAAPVATSDRVVWGKGKAWQHTLTLLAAPGSERAKAWAAGKAALPAGKYLVRVYVDRAGAKAADWRRAWVPDDYAGAVEVESRWPEGYGSMTTADAARVRRE